MSERLGVQRVLENPPENLIDGEASRGDDVDERKLYGVPPMDTLFSSMEKGPGARRRSVQGTD